MPHLTRRRFLSDSTIAAAVLAAGPGSSLISNAAEALTADTAASANDRLNVMVCGVRSRGNAHVRLYAKNRGCHVKYICDVDEAIGQDRVDEFEKQFGYRPKFVRDMRQGFDDKDLDGKVVEHFGQNVKGPPYTVGTISHIQNFIDAVKSRNPSDLNAEIREGHLSASLGHAATISYRLGKQASIGQVKEAIGAFGGDDDNLETLDRTLAHLKDNGVDLNETPMTLGPVLQMDAKTETFTNNDTANAMLTRKYRKNFEVSTTES